MKTGLVAIILLVMIGTSFALQQKEKTDSTCTEKNCNYPKDFCGPHIHQSNSDNMKMLDVGGTVTAILFCHA